MGQLGLGLTVLMDRKIGVQTIGEPKVCTIVGPSTQKGWALKAICEDKFDEQKVWTVCVLPIYLGTEWKTTVGQLLALSVCPVVGITRPWEGRPRWDVLVALFILIPSVASRFGSPKGISLNHVEGRPRVSMNAPTSKL